VVLVQVEVVVAATSLLSKFRQRSYFLVSVIVFTLAFQWTAIAGSTVTLMTHYYNLTPGLTITKPILSYENRMSLDTTINAKLTVDRVVTDYEGIDSVSGASQHVGELTSSVDTRQEYVVSAAQIIGDWTLSAAYLQSVEKDYLSHAPSIGVAKDFNRRNTTLSMGYAHNFDTVNGQYMDDEEGKDVDNYSVSLTQILSRHSLMQLGYTLQNNEGYLSTGNRQIVLENDLTFDEFLPSTRLRQAIAARYAHWFPTRTAIHFGYRIYQDDWELNSNTLEFKVYQQLSKRLKFRGEVRLYEQTEVEFMKSSYTGTEQYLTSASTLTAFSSQLYGLKLEYSPRSLADSQFQLKYERYEQSRGLTGDIFMLAAELVY